ncbi:MAG: Na(+)-translocating NADH-quinone reductase subunit F [Methanomassiliicoccales archaeon PtaU1.Bin030]|nr:MAG: Na(+)-translocating NADH-quinone reductase subunit F [Methanomassiliicoccales archaeon PtaU1.Bin030]
MAHKVTFFPGGMMTEVEDGETVLDAAVAVGAQINSVCGGKGTCTKCLVIIDGPSDSEMGKLSREEYDLGYRLACQTKIRGEVSVFIPEESQISEHQILAAYSGREAGELTPLTVCRRLDLSAPSLEDNRGDLERVMDALEVPSLEVPLPILRELPQVLREGGWQLSLMLSRWDGSHRLMAIEKGSKSLANYGIAVDIGTTTVVAELVDLNTGKTVAQASDYNRQLVCGEDVLSRIAYAEEKGVGRLNELVRDTVNGLITQLCAERDKRRRFHSGTCDTDIASVAVGGNTAMVHMLLGLDPTSIRYAPYISTTNVPPVLPASDIGIRSLPGAPVYCVPGRASYVGGDITADILLSGLHLRDELSLLIDVGTNGEVVLGNKEWLVGCSTSAGPAFEGGEVSCGMRAMGGAIDTIRITETDIDITIIGNKRPRGICGSGLIDLIAQMFLRGYIDKKGRIETDSSERVRSSGRGMEFVVHHEAGKRDIAVSDDDIANVIRTKAAIYAGCSVLLQSVDRSFGDIERLYIAGGFGQHIDIDNAQVIGLLPDVPRDRFQFLGNASLGGTKLCLLSEDMRAEALDIYRAMTYVDLSSSQAFFDQYSSALFLPHTDMDQFPEVRKRLEAARGHRGRD